MIVFCEDERSHGRGYCVKDAERSERMSKHETSERVKPWDAEECERSAEHDDQLAKEQGHPEIAEWFTRRATTLRAYAAALRLLGSSRCRLDPSALSNRCLEHPGRDVGSCRANMIDTIAKALRGEEE